MAADLTVENFCSNEFGLDMIMIRNDWYLPILEEVINIEIKLLFNI